MTVVINGTTGIDTGTGSLIAADATTPTYLDLFEDTDNGSNYVRLIAPTSIAANRTLTLPNNTGTLLSTASTGTVLQVVQATTNTPVTVATTTYTDTGLSATITPTSASSKILVMIRQNAYMIRASTASGAAIRLLRDSTTIFNPSASDTNGPYLMYITGVNSVGLLTLLSFDYLDSPNSTSAITYKTQGASYTALNSGQVKFQNADTVSNASSVITLLEIAG